MIADKWVARYVALAKLVATWSQDPTTQVGAVIVGADRRKIAVGYNGFPPGIADDRRLEDRATKHMLIQHAERNVLDNAQFGLRGSTLVVTRFPCHECTKSILSKGVARIICPAPGGPAWTDPAWVKSSECAAALIAEAGLELLHPGGF